MIKEQWPFQYAVIPIDECIIDHSYQRDSKIDWIKEKKECFDPMLVLTLVGSRRENGQVAIVDGQQRWLLLKELGIKHIPALLMQGLTPQDEAKLFANLNFEKNMIRAFFHYRALLFAGDKHIVAINDLIESKEFAVGAKLTTERTLAAAGTLVKIYNKDSDIVSAQSVLEGSEILARTLDVLNMAWRNRSESWKFAKTSGMLHGLSRWISINEAIEATQIAAAVEGLNPEALLQDASHLTSGSGSGKGRKVEQVFETRFRKMNPKMQRRLEAA